MAVAAQLLPLVTAEVEDFPVDLAWSPDAARLFVAGGEGRLFQVHAPDGAVQQIGEHAPGVLRVALAVKGTVLFSAGQDGSVRRWELTPDQRTPGKQLPAMREVHRATRWPVGLTARADGQQIAFASGRDLLVLDASGELVHAQTGHAATLAHLSWRGRNELIAAGNNVLYVDRIEERSAEEFVLEGTPVSQALSPDLKIVANGLADGAVNFRLLNLRKRSRMAGYEGKVEQLGFSANSRYLATASSGASSIVIWDFGGRGPEGSEPLQYAAHEDRVCALAWQSSGALLASAGRDYRVALWRPGMQNRNALDIQLLDGPAGMMSWSPDGKRLAVAQESGRIRLFSLKLA